jgi:rod shape-determining protein MreD
MKRRRAVVKQKFLLAFLLASLCLFLIHPLFPSLRLFAYSPFITLMLIHCRLQQALWASFIAGFILDLFSSGPMGLHALSLTLSSLLLFNQRKHFFEDNPYNLSLFTSLFSFTSTLFYSSLFFIFDRRVFFHGKWVITDLFLMPLVDGIYAAIWFTLPLLLIEKYKRKIKQNE